MTAVRRAPATFGQLSVMRSLAVHGPDGQQVANLVSVWEIPPGPDTAQAMDAWLRLVAAHESLRTTLHVTDDGVEQQVHAFGSTPLPTVDLADATPEAAHRIAADLAATPIDVERDRPWRAVVAVEQGDPVYLVAVVHHAAADNEALRVLEAQFLAALDGADVVADAQPADLAGQQRAKTGGQALAHWTAVWPALEAADREPGDRSPRRRASLYSPAALAATTSLSERLRVSPQSIVLAVGALALARHEGRDRVTFALMAANRLDRRWTGLVSSLNQYSPVTIEVDGDLDPDEYLTNGYLRCLTAYLHGSYDVDALTAALAEAGVADPDPTAFAKHFNFLGPVDAEPDAASPLRTSVAWRGSTQRTGPNLHLAIATGSGLMIGVGASEDYLPGGLPATVAAGIEAGLIRLDAGQARTVAGLDLTPVRPL
ncbi:hypothetical protein FHS29_007218 [Saccharothrix tamanrassetensis]|uniref:Condensation domain-containing protein n=1 Tax=Saccharothrix tamanrassetensis TaxID=1051531 RepID=A0A841CTH4_9PSEU|nr:condensation domain-containing protein [Saccharothrix tamanrassetensis]MBB5960590.1 hypothetical protein [Saccharothrix tamanrassetensis]